ncbi:MAG: TRAP transporter small permease [Deltaproteobacteria bacterium]|nr:TRAP transporter small permease [Deltaproteobacteria bacterium]
MGNLVKSWNTTEKLIVGVLSLVATIFAFSSTVLRYCFNYSPEWLEEVIIYLIIWSVFIIASSLAEERRHVSATFLVEHLQPKVRRVVEIITGFLVLGFCILVCFWGYQIVHIAYITDERSLTSSRYPLWIIYLSLPVGLTLVSIRYLRRLYKLLFRFQSVDLLDSHEMTRSDREEQVLNGEDS